jgi:hypothetical protein
MSKRGPQRELMAVLRDMKLTEYGSFIPAELVQEVLEIEMPEAAPKSVYDKLAIVEMSAIDYCRNQLLAEGKYIKQVANGYRILLPSENHGQIESYMDTADRKLSRALKLSRNTPLGESKMPDQTEARILMKMANQRKFGPPPDEPQPA